MNHMLGRIQRLSEIQGRPGELFAESARLAATALGVRQSAVFVLEDDGGRTRFTCAFHSHASAAAEVFEREGFLTEQEMARLLLRTADEPVKLVPIAFRASTAAVSSPPRIPSVPPPPTSSFTARGAVPPSAPATVAGHSAPTHRRAAPLSAPATVAAPSAARTSKAPVLRDPRATRPPPSERPARHSRAAREERYLVLVAITSGKQLIGWIALPGVTLSAYSQRDVEQDLVMLGLHCGYLARDRRREQRAGALTVPPPPPGHRMGEGREAATGTVSYAADSADREAGVYSANPGRAEVLDAIEGGELPAGVLVDTCGAPLKREATRLRLFPLARGRVLVVQWDMRGPEDATLALARLIARHVEFFVTSLRTRQESPRLQALALRISTDFSSLFEGASNLLAFDDLTLGFVLLDAPAGVAIEGVFGTERFNSTGASRVENEFLHEVAAVRGGDKLVYRERLRAIDGESGWLFALDDGARARLPEFARADFLERYFAARAGGPAALREAIAPDAKRDRDVPRCVLLLLVNEEHDERLRAG